ncbi:MAG: M23 family metallopeptidase [Clostridia bacterium]|nr:M23 family metallopeptidase [Clostridia bacterium]
MKQSNSDNKKHLALAAVWSAAILAVATIGLLMFFSAASRRTKVQPPEKTKETETQAVPTSPVIEDTDDREPSGWFSPANPLDTEVLTEKNTVDPQGEKTEEVDAKVPAVYAKEDVFSCIMPINGTVMKEFTGDVAVYSLTMNDYRVHNGIDIYAPVGTNVKACAAGTVERVWEDPFLGYCIQIHHGGDIRSLYTNLSDELPKGMEAGTTVLAGDVIGGVGDSMAIEMADSDHLHFSLMIDGAYVDPLAYMSNYMSDLTPEYES